MVLSLTSLRTLVTATASWASSTVHLQSLLLLAVVSSDKKGDVYNVLWVLVFGFATLNILSLVAKRFEPDRTRLSFGELLAIMVVVVSVLLLIWEMLYLFKILPIKLAPR
jgi:hypothetical protein